jgi:threonine dehydrogenase-like Zn-dependent dehydrogenase
MRTLIFKYSGNKMNALVLEGRQNIRLTNIKMPECSDKETLLKVLYCSICRTDAKSWVQGQRDLILPRVLGHEICGRKPGSDEQFIVWPASTCGCCSYCKSGRENLCSSIQVIGFHRDGGFADYIAVPKESLIQIPKNVPAEIACMTELMSSAINAVEQVNLQKNQKVLIYGGGPAGLLLALACKHHGAEPFVVEKSPEKMSLAAKFCKKAEVSTSSAPPSEAFDVAINAASDLNTFTAGIAKLKAGGKFCLFSGFTSKDTLQAELLNEVHYRQLTVVGAYGSTKRQMQTALEIFANNPETIRLLIHRVIGLEDVPFVLPEILRGQALKFVVKI